LKICKACQIKFSPKFNNQKCCSDECSQINYDEYRKRTLKHAKEYYSVNKEKIKINHKNYNIKNREKILNKQKEYNRKHKQEIKEYKSNYQVNYRKTHKEEIKLKARLYMKLRKKNNINFRLLCNMRKRIWNALRYNSKSSKTIKLLGCDIDFLRVYLCNLFADGMTWDNYGKWEIDHIIPCASFDLDKETEQYKCFHYTNLQPLWMRDNRIKH